MKIKRWSLRVFLVLASTALTLASYAEVAIAVEYVRMEVIGKNVNLRDAPSMKGKVASQASEEDTRYAPFIAEATPIVDQGDKSRWYKIIFGISDYDGSFFKPHNNDGKTYNALYLSAKFARQVPLTDFDKKQIVYYHQGRPLRYKTGEIVVESDNREYLGVFPIKQAVPLYLEPQKNAKKQTLPAGTKLLQYDGPGIGEPSYMEADGIFYFHMDMDDICWNPFIDENGRIIGWLPGEEMAQLKF